MSDKLDIFISYSHEDGWETAHALDQALTARGYRVWLDRTRVMAGHILEKVLFPKIDEATAFIAILTPGYVRPRKWTLREFEYAQKILRHNAGKKSEVPFIFPVIKGLCPCKSTKHKGIDECLRAQIYLKFSDGVGNTVERITKGIGVTEDFFLQLDQSLEISRFPVTNIEYRRFVNAGGYTNKGFDKYWSDDGCNFWLDYAARRPNPYFGMAMYNVRDDGTPAHDKTYPVRTEDETILGPLTLSNTLYNHYAQPVTGVSYYEAQAYCTWLSERLKQRIRLPTETEWLRAARPDGQKYPWGDEAPDHKRINIVDKLHDIPKSTTLRDLDLENLARVNLPTALGCHPDGVSHIGCHDMYGNVWEWLGDLLAPEVAATWFKDKPNEQYNIAKIAGNCCFDGAGRIEDPPRTVRKPGYRHSVIGFRIVREGGDKRS